MTEEEKYEKEQELREKRQQALDSWDEHRKNNESLKRYTGTDTNPVRYLGSSHAAWTALTFLCIIGGVILMFILGGMGHKHLAPKVFLTSLFAASLTGLAAYYSPLVSLRRHMARLEKRCTAEVRGRCVKVGRITYAEARSALIIGRMYRDPLEEESVINGELYYDPEYIIQYNGETYHLCERRFSDHPIAVDSERTLYIDPDAPNVFFDVNRYGWEYSRERKNCRAGAGAYWGFALITGALFVIFVLLR